MAYFSFAPGSINAKPVGWLRQRRNRQSLQLQLHSSRKGPHCQWIMHADSVVFAGIDYHKKRSVITLGDKDGTRVWQEKVFSDRETIISFFRRFPAGVSCAIKNTRATEWFIELLKEIGLKVHVSNTYA